MQESFREDSDAVFEDTYLLNDFKEQSMKDDTFITMYTLIPEPFPQWESDREEQTCGEVEKMKRDNCRNETICPGADAQKACKV